MSQLSAAMSGLFWAKLMRTPAIPCASVSGGFTVLGMANCTWCVDPLSQCASFELRKVSVKLVPSCNNTSAVWVLPFWPPPASSSPVTTVKRISDSGVLRVSGVTVASWLTS